VESWGRSEKKKKNVLDKSRGAPSQKVSPLGREEGQDGEKNLGRDQNTLTRRGGMRKRVKADVCLATEGGIVIMGKRTNKE